jgi:hypothetical protein
MKAAFLAGIAALLLATGTAQATDTDQVWHFDNYKRCTATTDFKIYVYPDPGTDRWPKIYLKRMSKELGPRAGPAPSVLEDPDTGTVVFERKHLAKLGAAVRFLKKCRVWVYDHHSGKTVLWIRVSIETAIWS